ncbi:hypothetical protein [Kalamiella sp. sgz302252]|uniref:hypothetical protein n=1 Tax=Pantoea sp. sgz302252 TaxID=3341827 RepID=UPI0036D254E9
MSDQPSLFSPFLAETAAKGAKTRKLGERHAQTWRFSFMGYTMLPLENSLKVRPGIKPDN